MIYAALVTLGSVLFIPLSVEMGYIGVLPGSIVWAFGASIAFPALAIAGLTGAKPGEEGLASGLIQTSQRLGFPLGIAVLTTVGTAVDPSLGVDAFRYMFIGSALLGAFGLGLTILLGQERNPTLWSDAASAGLGPIAEK